MSRPIVIYCYDDKDWQWRSHFELSGVYHDKVLGLQLINNDGYAKRLGPAKVFSCLQDILNMVRKVVQII